MRLKITVLFSFALFYFTTQPNVETENFQEDEEGTITDSSCQSHLIGKNNRIMLSITWLLFFS